jgi:hypothetical protein
MLGEFRNQIERLNAGTVQLREALPMDVGVDLVPALLDMESSLDGLTGLVSCLDAVILGDSDGGEQVISDLGDVIQRALVMTRPWLSSDVQVSLGCRVGAVRNRNRAVECALAAAIVSLAHTGDARSGSAPRQLHIEVFSARGSVTVEIECGKSQPARSSSFSWRWWLADRLAAVAGGTLETLPDRPGVGLRFQ